MTLAADKPAGHDAHCVRVDAGSRWSDRGIPKAVYAASGEALDVSIRVFDRDETVAASGQTPGEEIGAILEGEFDVEAAGERYVLRAGEAILIPPGAPRRWRCRSTRGVAYRVVVKTPALPDEVAS
jgi:mannose-6-phosphate isomerase-like protein (cupin superfamily)